LFLNLVKTMRFSTFRFSF